MKQLGEAASLVFCVVWVLYLIHDGLRARACRRAFNQEPRFCHCGGRREFVGRANGVCTDRCTSCGMEHAAYDHVYLVGHQCNERTIEPSGRCTECGRQRARSGSLPLRPSPA